MRFVVSLAAICLAARCRRRTLPYPFARPARLGYRSAVDHHAAVRSPVRAPDVRDAETAAGGRRNAGRETGRTQFEDGRGRSAGRKGRTADDIPLEVHADQRGDYVFAVQCDPAWMADEGVYIEDTVKVTVHVLAQKNWDAVAGARFELIPLTRPYGLRAGMVFQSLAISRDDAAPRSEFQPQPATLVEVERFNPTPPKELPPDEHVTRTLKTDPAGVATVTLTDAGLVGGDGGARWWRRAARR